MGDERRKLNSWRELLHPAWVYYNRNDGENASGGLFHVVLEDQNFELHFRESDLQDAIQEDDTDAIVLARLLVRASITQLRRLVLHRELYDYEADEPPLQ